MNIIPPHLQIDSMQSVGFVMNLSALHSVICASEALKCLTSLSLRFQKQIHNQNISANIVKVTSPEHIVAVVKSVGV